MARLLCLFTVVALLSSCAPAHYGYAPNLRPTLAQLSGVAGDPDNSYRASAQTAAAGEAQ